MSNGASCSKKGLVKEGEELAVVLDVNEMHPFQYDIYESGELPLIKGVPETGNREIIKTENSFPTWMKNLRNTSSSR